MGQGRIICLIAIRLHPPVTTTSRIGLPKGRSEAPGHLISTSLEAMRQVRGQLDELCDVFSPGWLQGLTQSAEVNATFAVSPAKPPDFVAVGPGRPLAELNAKRTGSSVHRVRQQGGPQHHLLEGDLHHARQVHEPLGQEGPRRVDRASAAQGGAGVRVDVARRDGEVGAGRGVEVGAPLGQDAPQLGMVALAGALLPGGQRVAVEDPAAALAGLEAASLDGEGVRELAPAVGEELIRGLSRTGQDAILLYEVAPGASAEMSASLPARVCIAPESIRYSAPKCNN